MAKERNIFLILALFYGILFLQYPLGNKLPGNCDTWMAISLSNSYWLKFKALLGGSPITQSMYPVANMHAYGESSPGLGLLFILCRILVGGDVWAYYLFLTIQFVLSSFAAYKLAFYYLRDQLSSLFVSICFMCANFVFSNIDDTLVIFYFFPLISLLILLEGLHEGRPKKVLFSALLLGVQSYFSFYVFFYHALLLLLFVLFHLRQALALPARAWGIAILGFALTIAPITYYYLTSHFSLNVVNPYNVMGVIKSCSIRVMDFFRVLPQNLLYPHIPANDGVSPYWSTMRRNAFLGLVQMGLALYGLKDRTFAARRIFMGIAVLGLALSMGMFLHFDDRHFTFSPMYLFYAYFPFASYLRVSLRAYMLFLLAVAMFAGVGMRNLLQSKRWPLPAFLTFGLLLSLHLLENTPFPFKGYSLSTSPEYLKKMVEEHRPQVLLNLPAYVNFNFTDSGMDIYSFNREVLYMNWQTEIQIDIVNGVNGYIPQTRYKLHEMLGKYSHRDLVEGLRLFGVDYIILHKNLILSQDRAHLERMRSILNKFKMGETGDYVLWKIGTTGNLVP